MRRFQFDDNSDDDEDEEDFRENAEFMQSPFLSMTQFPFDMSGDPLLESSIKICENSIFWKFYSIKTKLLKIKEVYNFLISLDEKITEDNKDKNA